MGDASRMASKLSNDTVWMWFDSETHAIWSPQNLNLLVPRGWKLHPTVVSRGRHLGKWWDCSSGALWNNPVGFIRDRETCALPALCHESLHRLGTLPARKPSETEPMWVSPILEQWPTQFSFLYKVRRPQVSYYGDESWLIRLNREPSLVHMEIHSSSPDQNDFKSQSSSLLSSQNSYFMVDDAIVDQVHMKNIKHV